MDINLYKQFNNAIKKISVKIVVLCICSIFINTANGQQTVREIIDAIDPFDQDRLIYTNQEMNQLRQDAYRAYQEKNYTVAAKIYLYLLQFDYNDKHYFYNLACCYGLLNKPELAAEYLTRAVNSGFRNYQHILDDTDFNNVRNSTDFASLEKKIVINNIRQGKVLYIKGEKVIKCRIKLPTGYDPDKSYPLLIALHGYGGNPENFMHFGDKLNKSGVILAVPEAPYLYTGDPYGIETGFSWEIRVRDQKLWNRADPLSVNYIVNVADHFKENYNVKEIYLLGFSQGVAYTYYAGIKNPDLFSGIICCAGIFPDPELEFSLLTQSDIPKASTLPVFIANGKQDTAVDFSKSIAAQEYLENAGYPVKLYLFDGHHTVPAEIPVNAIKWFSTLK